MTGIQLRLNFRKINKTSSHGQHSWGDGGRKGWTGLGGRPGTPVATVSVLLGRSRPRPAMVPFFSHSVFQGIVRADSACKELS